MGRNGRHGSGIGRVALIAAAGMLLIGAGAQAQLLEEGFEAAVVPPAGWAMYQTGDAGDPGFVLTTARVHSGVNAAFHNDNDLAGSAISWLVTPQLAIPSDQYYLHFWQNQNYDSWYVYHGIWVSTGSGDPTHGDFVELVGLGAGTEDVWEKISQSLAAYSGQSIYLAFRYEGDWADEWYLDDVLVIDNPVPVELVGFTVD